MNSVINLQALANAVGIRLVASGRAETPDVSRIYASDCMSDILNHVDDKTLLVTNLTNAALVRVIELMDIPGICLLNGAEPEEAMVSAAARQGAAVLVSPDDMFETCGRLYQVLGSGNPTA